MDAIGEFLAMGGYAAYVWPAYAVSAVALGGVVLWSLHEHRRVREETLRRARQPRRRRS